jgi:hypothetical protein
MSAPQLSLADAERSRMRVLLATLEREIARLPQPAAASDGAKSVDTLRTTWAQLVGALALGPEPELRQCPVCGHQGMRAATRCGYCWTKLSPPA